MNNGYRWNDLEEMLTERFADFIIMGVFAHHADERCEPLSFRANEERRGVSAGR